MRNISVSHKCKKHQTYLHVSQEATFGYRRRFHVRRKRDMATNIIKEEFAARNDAAAAAAIIAAAAAGNMSAARATSFVSNTTSSNFNTQTDRILCSLLAREIAAFKN
jgi:hypothetical protein